MICDLHFIPNPNYNYRGNGNAFTNTKKPAKNRCELGKNITKLLMNKNHVGNASALLSGVCEKRRFRRRQVCERGREAEAGEVRKEGGTGGGREREG